MSKIAIIYWSGTGNTEAMAKAILSGALDSGAEATLFEVGGFSADKMADYDAFMFGCPAMGAEELEEETFLPFFEKAEANLKDIPVALFGSYGWGGGEWMQSWSERTKNVGAKVFREGLAIENTPTEENLVTCKKFAEDFVKSL